MGIKKSAALASWKSKNKYCGLCEECISKTNKDIAFFIDRDLCQKHYITFFNERLESDAREKAGK